MDTDLFTASEMEIEYEDVDLSEAIVQTGWVGGCYICAALTCLNHPRYRYSALQSNEIRILHLQPGVRGAPLCAFMEHVSLDTIRENDIRYEAVSYAWGSSRRRHAVHFEDQTTIEITASLYEVFQRFSLRGESRAIWADQICINQRDNVERSSQVALMAQIFRSSAHVLVWLGETEAADIAAFAAMQACTNVSADEQTGDWRHVRKIEALAMNALGRPCCNDPAMLQDGSLSEHLTAFVKLLERPWFSRLWVVQEVAAGKSVRVHSGRHCVPWAHLAGTARQLQLLRSQNIIPTLYREV